MCAHVPLRISAREKSLYGSGGDVAKELIRLRSDLEQEIHFRLLPGYVRQYIEQAAPLVDIQIEGDTGGIFAFRSKRLSALDPILAAMEIYPEKARNRLSISRPADLKDSIWLRPGEPVFEQFRSLVFQQFSDTGLRGAVFVDPMTDKPYLFHMALLSIIRKADPEIPELSREETLESCLVGVKQYEGAEVVLCPVEYLLLLKGGYGLPASGQRLAVAAKEMIEQTLAFLIERIGRKKAVNRKKRLLGIYFKIQHLLKLQFIS